MTTLRIDSDQKERVAAIVQTAISSEIKRLELGLNRSNRCIEAFEKKYKVSSDDFLSNFTAENMKEGDGEYIQWAGELQMRARILEDLQSIKDIEYAA